VCCRRSVQLHLHPSVTASASSGAASALGVLQATRPIDRLRYQAKLIFDYFDQDRDGQLSATQVGQYVEYCNERFGAGRSDLDALYTPLLVGGNPLGFEEFVELVRGQVKALSVNGRFVEGAVKGTELGRLLYKCAITTAEMSAALAVFKLLDFNADGYVRIDELERAQGIEKKVLDDVLRDADENNDGFLSFEDWLDSYARERPALLAMAVLAAHTAVYYLIFNSPVDTLFKAVLAVLVLLKPQFITNPVIKIYHIVKALMDRGRATQALGGMGAPGTA